MMMTQVANHSKRNHTDSYFSGKQQAVATTTTSSGSEEFGGMGSKKPRNASPRGGGPISPKEKKDKVGERVAALQQLVSPFGKTDTASVLQEASGYIKFLHQQLEVLSSPYMRPPPAPGAEPEDPDVDLCFIVIENMVNIPFYLVLVMDGLHWPFTLTELFVLTDKRKNVLSGLQN